jgi:hypothetical protein
MTIGKSIALSPRPRGRPRRKWSENLSQNPPSGTRAESFGTRTCYSCRNAIFDNNRQVLMLSADKSPRQVRWIVIQREQIVIY